jgi:CRP-like cAMP-binding protein
MENDITKCINNLLNQYSSMNTETISEIIESGECQTVKKNNLIFQEKRYNAFEYFQLEGVSHRYNTDEDSQMVTTGVYSGGEVITPHFARTTESQSIFSLQALTDCTYFRVPIGSFDKLRDENAQIGAFGQRVVEREFIRHLNYEVLFRSRSAKDRILYFRSVYPMLENLIPHTVIASFLGITPVSFSRLRNELVKKK